MSETPQDPGRKSAVDDEILPPDAALVSAERGGGTPSSPRGNDFIRRGTPEFRRMTVAMFIGGFSTFALLYCVQPLMPVLAADFSLTAASSSLVLSVSAATLAIGLIFTGPISDTVGRRPIMIAALVGAALCGIGSALMPNWQGVLIMRALLGLCLSGLVAVAMTYLSEEIDPSVIGFSMGLYIGGNALGGMCGRLLVGVVSGFFSWRVALGTLGTFALAGALIFCRIAPPSRHFQRAPLKLRGLGEGLALHFKDRALPWLFLEGFLLMGGFVTLFNYISYRLLAEPFKLSQATVSLLSTVYISGIYSSARVGLLADKFGRRKVFWIVTGTMLAGVLITLSNSLWLVLGGLLIFTFGFFGAHSVASSWIGRRARRARGQASSLYLLSYYLGSGVAGTTGGFFWHHAGWTGVVLFISSLLTVALLIGIYLIFVPPLPEPAAR
jgi:YNFM family putative membrane transporter